MTETKPPIVFDLDDVLARFNPMLCHALAEITGDKSVLDDWRSWKQYDIAGNYPQIPVFDEVFHHMERTGMMARLEPESAVVQIANHYAEMGHPIIVLTARGWMADAEGVSAAWLKAAGVNYTQLIVSGHQISKKYYMPDGVHIYFDDNSHHVMDCAPLVREVVLVARPWNEAATPNLPANARRLAVEQLYRSLGDLDA